MFPAGRSRALLLPCPAEFDNRQFDNRQPPAFMTPSFAISLDALSGWRTTLARRLDEVARYLSDHEMVDAPAALQTAALRERLANEKLVVAFVAEF